MSSRSTHTPLRALVTNDDGVDSPGLRYLAEAAEAAGMDVLVVAPAWDSSGSSASLTVVSRDGKVLVERAGRSGAGYLGVHGPPAFIVRSAIYGAFGPPPDVVLSGINRGLNYGRPVLHSGTVGAALTAAIYGKRALALSADMGETEDWSTAGVVAGSALEWLSATPEGTVLNVNVPGRRVGPRGVRVTTLAETGTVQAYVTEADGGTVPVTFADEEPERQPGTDSAALADGFVSVTAIRPVCDDERLDLDQLARDRGWLGAPG